MKKRYIVCINNSTKEQDQLFLAFIKEHGFGWWHHIKNTWLLTDTNGFSNISNIRDKVKELFTDEYNMVFQLNKNEGTWSGFGPNTEDKNMFKWIKDNWK